MSTHESNDPDPWLTIAEIADELHLTPAAIRLWISKGMLLAKRAGMRKLLVHRSDLDWMLREREAIKARRQVDALESRVDQTPELSATGRVKTDSSGERPADHERVMFALKMLSQADEELAAARADSENAPPDADFPHRVRELAHSFMRQSEALSRAANIDRVTWNPAPPPRRQQPISHELRPGGNRPGPPRLWEAFDRAVDEVAVARAGSDMRTLAVQTNALAMRLHDIADALGERPREFGE
ncbi:MAG: helix-turn-helix domain-containing protein [Solirubrobacteraceae bacterium]